MRHFQIILLALSALVSALPVECPTGYCTGTIDSGNASYVCGDMRLGPVDLPTKLPLSNTVYGYSRFGGLCPKAYLATWYNDTGNSSTSSYIYPPNNGAQSLSSGMNSLNGTITLQPGAYIDRFGRESGQFLAPYGTPYDMRALPPNNLITYNGNYPFNYYVYEVKKPFDVIGGVIAGWFEQPGQGVQYYSARSVTELLQAEIIRKVDLDELT